MLARPDRLIYRDPPPAVPEINVAELLEVIGALYPDDVRFSPAVERWRILVARYFPREWITWALETIRCESRGRPEIRNGSHVGLFQQSTRYWASRSRRAGWAGYPPTDPEANIAVSAWLLLEARGGGLGHWSCKAPEYAPYRP